MRTFKIPNSRHETDWSAVESRFARNLTEHSNRKAISTTQGHKIEYDELNTSQSKAILDEIDRVLGRHYGFTEEELDFIVYYDIKYRMGRDSEEHE